jgi:hypothetical protein
LTDALTALEGLGALAGEEASDSAGAAVGAGASVVFGSEEDAVGGVGTETVAGLARAVEACRGLQEMIGREEAEEIDVSGKSQQHKQRCMVGLRQLRACLGLWRPAGE